MYFEFDDPTPLAARLATVPRGEHDWLLIYVCRAHVEAVGQLADALRAAGVRAFGAVVPGLIRGSSVYETGVSAFPVPLIGEPVVADLSGPEIERDRPMPSPSASNGKTPTALVLVDCTTGQGTRLLDQTFDHYGHRTRYFGGGVGLGGRRRGPTVITPRGTHIDAGLIALLDLDGQVTVRHGWVRHHGPLVATRTRGEVIEELNWEPAASVYARLLGIETPGPGDEPIAIPSGYPFGIASEGQEDIVRDTLALLGNGTLTCLSEVPEHSVMYVLRADADALIAAAQEACGACAARAHAATRLAMVFDCNSRVRVLGDRFDEELAAMSAAVTAHDPRQVLEGVLAHGEIASNGQRRPEFHNKTVALGLLHD